MKFPFFMSAIAVTTTVALAQQVPATAATPDSTAKPSVETPVAPADSVVKADSTIAQSAPAPDSTAAPTAEANVAVVDSAVTDSSVAKADSTVAQANATVADSTVAQAPADSVVAEAPKPVEADSAATAEKVETKQKSSFVADDTPPPAKLLSGTKISGKIHGFLKADESPYLVDEDISVEPNSVLVIEQGVVLQFAPNTGMYVNGLLIVAGTRNSNVEFKSASSLPQSGDWKGIFITGDSKSEIRNAVVDGAVNGIVVENGGLSLQSSIVRNTSGRALFSRNAQLNIGDCGFFDNKGAAIHLANHSVAEIERTRFIQNNVALLNAELAQASLISATFEGNQVGIVDKGNTYLTFKNTKVRENKTGAVSDEVLEKSVLASIEENDVDFGQNTSSITSALPEEPVFPGIQSRQPKPSESINDLITEKNRALADNDTTPKQWSVIGNVMLGGNYHIVQTRRNHNRTPDYIGNDTIDYKEHYKNNFQVPGFGGEASAYMLMTSPSGTTIEFNTNLTADSWNHFAPNPVTLTIKDQQHQLILGDNQKTAGDIYMSGLQLFGIDYTLSLLKNNADKPLFQLGGFGGEVRKPYLVGERHPDIYNEYIDDGEAQAQRMAYGASLKWAPDRRFDATLGVLYSNDEMEDPILRDGSSRSVNATNEPMQTALTAYADGSWLFYPGDIALRGMIAVGRADTAQVNMERAINKVFSEANLNVSSYRDLRDLMSHPEKISKLSNSQLQEIFGENSMLSYREMKDSLQVLLREAKLAKEDADNDTEDGRVAGLNWGSQNFAIGASLDWTIYKTRISGHIKYVGEDYYGVGSADQRADTREFGGELEQIISKTWTLNFAYDLNVENAANDKKTNLFGLNEGTRWGLFTEASQKWKDEHELDKDRAKYIQKFSLTNSLKINDKFDLKTGYIAEYRTQYRQTQLHGDYILDDKVYADKWFAPRKDKATITISNNGENFEVDEERWTEYNSLGSEKYIASNFQEKTLKQTVTLNGTLRALSSVIKLGGRWTVRTDFSEFKKDSLMQKFDLADSTWGKLGYYFGGADFFEQSYPISVTTTLSGLQNRFAATPRFKSYTRDDMSESEITLDDELEIPFLNNFLVLGLNGQFRYLVTSWEENGRDLDETETDVLADLSLKINHTKKFSTQWYTGTGMYYRPDNRSNEYKDTYFGMKANYSF